MNPCFPALDDLLSINRRLAGLNKDARTSHGPADAYVPASSRDQLYCHNYEFALIIASLSLPARRLEKRRLLLALRGNEKANALALPCMSFDAILLNQGLLDKLGELMDYFMDRLINSVAARGLGERYFTLQLIEDQSRLGVSPLIELARSIYRCALTFVIGHELGHLGSGHLSYGHHLARGALATHASSISFQDLKSQAQELDADMQGWVFTRRLHENWGQTALYAVKANGANEHLVRSWLWDQKPRMTFVYTVAILVVYAAFGLDRPTIDALAHKTHPPTSIRAKVLLDSILLGQVQRDMEHEDQHRLAAREANLVFGIAMAAYQQNLGQPDFPTNEREIWGAQLDQPEKFAMDALAQLGLFGPNVDDVKKVQEHVEALARKWAALKPLLQSRTRWQARYLANWCAIGTPQKTRQRRRVDAHPYLIV